MSDTVPYERDVLVRVIVYHQRHTIGPCACGWFELGRSHAEHVATVYEESVTALAGGPVVSHAVRCSSCECLRAAHRDPDGDYRNCTGCEGWQPDEEETT